LSTVIHGAGLVGGALRFVAAQTLQLRADQSDVPNCGVAAERRAVGLLALGHTTRLSYRARGRIGVAPFGLGGW